MIGLLEDIDKEKRSAGVARARTEAIIESMGDGVCVTNTSGRILFCNQVAASMLGIDAKSVIGSPWSELSMFKGLDGKPVEQRDFPISRASVTGKPTVQELFIVNDGKELPSSIVSAPVAIDGKAIGGVAVMRDITAEYELIKAKDEFISIASHQLRTPLTTINWYTESITDGDYGALADELREPIETIRMSSQHLVKMVNSLLNASRVELDRFSVNPEPCDIATLVQEVMKDVVKGVPEEPKVTVRIDKNVPVIMTDPNLTRIVFQNLIHNAVKYTPTGGSVSLNVAKKGEDLVVMVKDTGMGIPEDQKKRIFQKMFRASNAERSQLEGTGLGLYLVKAIVEKTGGTIDFTSVEGKGSTFTVTMPIKGMAKKEGTKTLVMA